MQVDRIGAELHDADARAVALAGACSLAQWQARPAAGGWSPSDCLQHLVLSVDAMLSKMTIAIDEGLSRGVTSAGPFRPGLIGRLLLWSIEPPYRMKSTTGPTFVPGSTRAADEDVAALREAHDRARASLDRARGLDLTRLSIVSPFDRRVRYNLYTAFALLPTHARRHLWQAEQTLRRASAR